MLPHPPGPPAGKTILTTFAGRRDRMQLLCRYARAALARGIVDEWHVWDFSRNPADAAWLREEFPNQRMTPGQGLDYVTAPIRLLATAAPATLRFAVCARNDVHIGLLRETGEGESYEIVLGGWSNSHCVIRTYTDPALLRYPGERPPNERHVVAEETQDLLPDWGFADVSLRFGADGIVAHVNGKAAIALPGPVVPGSFRVLYRSGFGADAEWRFPDAAGPREFLFHAAPPRPDKDGVPYPFYLPFYRHYARQGREYQNDVILKCDDDIVFVDLEGLRRFIAYRRLHPEYFMLSANVVNNGVCAHYQQLAGLIPRELLELELPPHGLCGTLWGSAAMAETLHAHFLANPTRFTGTAMGLTEWRERLSINFIALLGTDLVHIPDIMWDDEDFLSYGGRIRARKPNAIFGPFCVSHLSFMAQDGGMDHARLLDGYGGLAERLAPAPDAPSAAAMRQERGEVVPRSPPRPGQRS